jgi:hypothetical protein
VNASRRAKVGADIALAARRADIRLIRQVSPEPFGLVPSTNRPEPERIGSVSGIGTARNSARRLVRMPRSISTMKIRYGDANNPFAPLVDVISDLSRSASRYRTVTDELEQVILRDTDNEPSSTNLFPIAFADEDVSSSSGTIAVGDAVIAVRIYRVGDYAGFEFKADGVDVMVTMRNQSEDNLKFVRLRDLTSLLDSMELIRRDDIADWFDTRR